MTTQASERVKRFPTKRDGYYRLEDPAMIATLGRDKFVAVTEILQVIGKGGLPYAAAKKAAEIYMDRPYDFQKAEEVASAVFAEWRKKASLGKTIHSLAEALGKGSTVEPIGVHEGYANAVRGFFAAARPTAIEVEVNVYNSKVGYAGTSDLLAVYPDGLVYLTDFKTSPQVYAEAKLQLRGYRECDWMLTAEGLKPMPKIDATAVVLLGEDGNYSWHVVDAPYEAFLAAKTLWQWFEGVA